MSGGLFKEPAGGWRPWLLTLIGCYLLVEAVLFREATLDRIVFVAFGAAILSLGAADLLPRRRAALAGLLRVVCIGLVFVALVVRLVQLVGPA